MFRLSSTAVPDDSVKVILECIGAPETVSGLKHPIRQLKLTTASPPITIGRASKNALKNIQPSSNNAFFDCAVMSRNHAEVYLRDGTKDNVVLKDTGSLHGTFVNDIKVGNDFDIHQGDIIRFGDKVSRLAAIHDGIEVRVSIDRPHAMTSSSVTSQATLNGAPIHRTNTYAVPSESSDDHPPKESGPGNGEDEDAEDYEDVTPSDDDDTHSVEFVSATRSFPLSQKYANNDKATSSGRSQMDPVMIDDEIYHAQDPFDDKGLDDESVGWDSEIEYADDGGDRSPGSDVPSKNGSIRSQRYSPSSPRTRTAVPDQSDDEESDDSDMSEDELSPKQSGGVKVPDEAPPAKEHTKFTASIFHSARASSIPETLKLAPIMPPHSASFNESLAPINQVSNYAANSAFCKPQLPTNNYIDIYERNESGNHTEYRSPFSFQDHNVPSPYVYKPARQSDDTAWHYSGTEEGRIPTVQTSSWASDGVQVDKDCTSIPLVDLATKPAESGSAAFENPTLAEPAVKVSANDKMEQAHTDAEVTGGNKKRKREAADDDEVEEHETNESPDGVLTKATRDESSGTDYTTDDVTQKRHDSASQMVGASQPSVSASGGAIQSIMVTPPAVTPAVTRRPAKRARTSSVSLALTAAVGAVSGCVATVGFLWSPLAERLLA